jgi:hypothetical protein
MQTKRNKFWTVFFSFLPGAGHMFMGFMKLGVSFMALFFFCIFLSSFFSMEALLFPLPIIFFFSFFDSINKMSLPDEKFMALEDKFLVISDSGALPFDTRKIFSKSRPFIGALLIFSGVYIISSSMFWRLSHLLTDTARDILIYLINNLPSFGLAGIIIYIGVRLIAGKKKEVE